MAEWFKAHAWKACVAKTHRGFESLSLRQLPFPDRSGHGRPVAILTVPPTGKSGIYGAPCSIGARPSFARITRDFVFAECAPFGHDFEKLFECFGEAVRLARVGELPQFSFGHLSQERLLLQRPFRRSWLARADDGPADSAFEWPFI